jgi:hypothetical protein
MKPASKPNPKRNPTRHTPRTTEDFLRWLQKQDRGNGRVVEGPGVPIDPTPSRALMIWADDGGA